MGQAIPGAVSQPLRTCGAPTTQSTDGSGNVYCAQDFLKYGDFQPEETRYGGTFRFTVQLTPDIQALATATYYQNQTVVDQAPLQIQTGTPNNTNNIALPALLPNGELNPNDPFAALGEAALINYAFGDILLAPYRDQPRHPRRDRRPGIGLRLRFHRLVEREPHLARKERLRLSALLPASERRHQRRLQLHQSLGELRPGARRALADHRQDLHDGPGLP